MRALRCLCTCLLLIGAPACTSSYAASAGPASCKPVELDPELQVHDRVLRALDAAGMDQQDLYRVMQIIAGFETNGCWANATGNADKQLLSVGVMQWNLGQKTLQELLNRYKDKFQPPTLFHDRLNELMPNFGRPLFDLSCRTQKRSDGKYPPVTEKCRSFLSSNYRGKKLAPDFQKEVDDLFESKEMRQIQLDMFAAKLTSVLDDVRRVFGEKKLVPWRIAWAMDLKTQQDRFPGDTDIKKLRVALDGAAAERRTSWLLGTLEWYRLQIDSPHAQEGVRKDWEYNIKVWTSLIRRGLPREREEAVHLTKMASQVATSDFGKYQANAFQRRATIAFGKGSVHDTRYEFQK
jgi:hypothetical protein